jgi:hypothetical protein
MVDREITQRIQNLIGKGTSLRSSAQSLAYSGVVGASPVDFRSYSEWYSQSLVLLDQLFGKDHVYTNQLRDIKDPGTLRSVDHGLGVLSALLEDVKAGYLFSYRTLVSAEVFSDFLDMAVHLLETKYKDPAAMLAGAVLEDGLRRIAEMHSTTVQKRESISSLNQKLADKGVYTRLEQSRVRTWNTIRNSADHGKFVEYTHDDVVEMVNGIKDFLTQYYAVPGKG